MAPLRVLRKIAGMEVTKVDLADPERIKAVLGDVSTLADPSVVELLIEKMANK